MITTTAAQTLPQWLLLVFLLGMRHGLDPDHIAAIDGLSRFNAGPRPGLARWTGLLFSLGHGLVVTGVALAVALAAGAIAVPPWFEALGVWTSVTLLLLIGAMNLMRLLRGPASLPAGPMSAWLRPWMRTTRPGMMVLIGALFALAFDTLSQTAAWALAGSVHGGWPAGAALGLAFMAGMIVTDGLNGLWVAHLLRRTDARARRASRIMGGVISALACAVAFYEAVSYLRPALASWAPQGMYAGVAVIALVTLSFGLARLRGWQDR